MTIAAAPLPLLGLVPLALEEGKGFSFFLGTGSFAVRGLGARLGSPLRRLLRLFSLLPSGLGVQGEEGGGGLGTGRDGCAHEVFVEMSNATAS